ncbi:hypothetical protein ACEQUB_00422 [Ralstonia syzygii]
MPIYAYRCDACGHAKDVLQKMSDAPLTDCPTCGAPAFKKQLTAAGFQLKGSGWYVTDFRGGAGRHVGDQHRGQDRQRPLQHCRRHCYRFRQRFGIGRHGGFRWLRHVVRVPLNASTFGRLFP